MFWQLLLAHFLADYPLQPTWMAKGRRNTGILLLHVGTHFAVSSALVTPYFMEVWRVLLALAGIHFVIDFIRVRLKFHPPQWSVAAYVVDQSLHYLSIAWAAALMAEVAGPFQPAFPAPLAIYLTGYLLVSYVWMITERLLSASGVDLGLPLKIQAWPRLVTRVLMLSLFLIALQPGFSLQSRLAAASFLPYLPSAQPWKALMLDLLIVLLAWLFIRSAVAAGLG